MMPDVEFVSRFKNGREIVARPVYPEKKILCIPTELENI
jgi:hypothetical protein